jgi:uncharacterized integral membrane protein
MVRWILALVVMLLVAIFAVQNARPVPVHVLLWTAPGASLSVVILLAALLGALVGWAGAVLDARRRERARRLPTLPAVPATGGGDGTDAPADVPKPEA